MSVPWLVRAVTNQHQRGEVTDAIRTLVRLHLEDYEDQTDVDPAFREALDRIGEYSDVDVADLVDEVKRDITGETGRQFDVDEGSASEAVCRHCGRRIVDDGESGLYRWIDPEATGDDSVWREVCADHETFSAEHEPR